MTVEPSPVCSVHELKSVSKSPFLTTLARQTGDGAAVLGLVTETTEDVLLIGLVVELGMEALVGAGSAVRPGGVAAEAEAGPGGPRWVDDELVLDTTLLVPFDDVTLELVGDVTPELVEVEAVKLADDEVEPPADAHSENASTVTLKRPGP